MPRFIKQLPASLAQALLEVEDSRPRCPLALTSCSNSFRICLPLKATMRLLRQWLSHTTASHSNIRADSIP